MSALPRLSTFAVAVASLLSVGGAAANPPDPFIPQGLLGQYVANRTGQFGTALDVYGDTLVVGAPTIDITGSAPVENAGRVYLHSRVDGRWVENSFRIITAPAEWQQADMHFGAAVAMVGDRLMVGAPDEDVGSAVDAGAVYFYRRDVNGSWQFDERQPSFIVQAGQRLGSSVAISSSYAVAGAPGYDLDSLSTDTGRVQMFRRATTDANYLIDGDLHINAGDSYAAYGSSVYVQDFLFLGLIDRMFVGAPNRTVGGLAITGATYCYERSGGNWVLRDVLAPAIAVGDFFGSTVVANGDYLFVGSRGRDRPGGPAAAGSVVVFERNADGTYGYDGELFANDAQASAYFGTSVAIANDGSRLAIGAPRHNGGASDSGRAYLFQRQTVGSLTFWSQSESLGLTETESEGSGDRLGSAVAIADEEFFAGAPLRTVNDYVDAGSVQIYGSETIFADGFD